MTSVDLLLDENDWKEYCRILQNAKLARRFQSRFHNGVYLKCEAALGDEGTSALVLFRYSFQQGLELLRIHRVSGRREMDVVRSEKLFLDRTIGVREIVPHVEYVKLGIAV